MTVDEIFQQADADMESARQNMTVPQKQKKSLSSFLVKSFIAAGVIILIVLIGGSIYIGKVAIPMIKEQIADSRSAILNDIDWENDKTIPYNAIYARELLILFDENDQTELIKKHGLTKFSRIMNFELSENELDMIPEDKRDAYIELQNGYRRAQKNEVENTKVEASSVEQ